MAKIIIANKNKKMDNLLMPCMYLTQDPFGSFSSFLLKYKYSPICFNIPIVFWIGYKIKLVLPQTKAAKHLAETVVYLIKKE